MKVLVIPDIHLKPWMVKKAKELMHKESFDKAVFLGDFVDDWDEVKNIGLYNETFDATHDFLKEFPESLICIGNHDISYVWNKWQSGFSNYAVDTVRCRLKELKRLVPAENIAFIHRIDTVLFSHAGLCESFVQEHFEHPEAFGIDELIAEINCMRVDDLWRDNSPLWVRPQYGYCPMYSDLLQVVGHTPTATCELKDKVLSVDVFSTHRDKTPVGCEWFVCVDTETGEFKEFS